MTASTPPDEDREFDAETEMLAAFVDAMDTALQRIDTAHVPRTGDVLGESHLSPTEQLAVLAVAAVRGIMPTLRDELDRRLA